MCSGGNCRKEQGETSGSVGGRDGGARKEFRMPLLDRDEKGNIFFREYSGDQNFQPSENGSPSSSKPSSRPARKSNGARETKVVNGKSASSGVLTENSVKVNLASADPRARRLASAATLANNNNNKGSPLYSKAARRFYNEKFRAEPQRLNKVLAAVGGRRYVATVNDRVTRRQLQTIASGTMVQGVQCMPKEVELLDVESGEERPHVRIVVSEGRNHEVRHLIENSGLQVLALKRTRIGGLRLSRKLGIGKFDSLSTTQIAEVLNKNV